MIRVVIYLILVAAAAYGVVQFPPMCRAASPSSGWACRYKVLAPSDRRAPSAALTTFGRALFHRRRHPRHLAFAPHALSRMRRTRRGLRAYEAMSHGLIAIGAGDIAAAQRFAAKGQSARARRAAGAAADARRPRNSPATATAPSARFEPWRPRRDQGARPARPVHRGATPRRSRQRARLRRGSRAHHARARLGRPGGAGIRCATGDWAGALALLDRNPDASSTTRAIAASARYCSRRARWPPRRDRDAAKALALEAIKLAPPWCPPPRLPAGSSPRAASCARPTASSKTPGAPIRIPIWRKPTPNCAPAKRARPAQADRGAGETRAGPHRGGAGGRARRARRAGVRQGAQR